MVIIVFRARLRPDVDQQAMAHLGQRMYEIASSMPGFISYKDFAAGDGEGRLDCGVRVARDTRRLARAPGA